MSKRLVLLLMAVASAGYVCRVAVTVVAPGIMRDFGLTQTQMGTVFSAFLVGYTVFQVPSGGLADRVSARRIFLVLCGGWALLTALTGLVAWRGFGLAMVMPQLWLIRAGFGVIAAPTYPTAGRTIAVTTPPRLQARANSLVLASVGVGSAGWRPCSPSRWAVFSQTRLSCAGELPGDAVASPSVPCALRPPSWWLAPVLPARWWPSPR
jgi:MFS transporter, ACS family, glucarate transporter